MAATTAEEIGNVEPLRPIRVLLSSQDKRLVAAATFLLMRRRFSVEAVERDALLRTVEETRPDVVVLDASGSVSTAARTAGAIEGRHPRTRVVLLTDDPLDVGGTLRTLPKWDGLERLADAVVRAYSAPA